MLNPINLTPGVNWSRHKSHSKLKPFCNR